MSETKQKSPMERLDMLVESMRIVSDQSALHHLALAATVAIRDELVALGKDRDDLQRQLGQIRQPDPLPATPAPSDPWGGRKPVVSPWETLAFGIGNDHGEAPYVGSWWVVAVYDRLSERDSITIARWGLDPMASPQWLLPYAMGPNDRTSQQPGGQPHGRLMPLGPQQRLWKVLARLPSAFIDTADLCWSGRF